MTDYSELLENISDEADLCRNDGADDIAALLDGANSAIKALCRELMEARTDSDVANKAYESAANDLDYCRAERDALRNDIQSMLIVHANDKAERETLTRELADTKARLAEAVGAPRFVTLGAGKVVSVWGHYDEKPAVFIRPLANGETGEEGCPARNEHKHSPDSLHPHEVVIILEGEPSAFLDDLNSARTFLAKHEASHD